MKIRDFLKDRIAYLLVCFACVSASVLIMALNSSINGAEFDVENMLYAYFITLAIVVIFLAYEYSKAKSFCGRLSEVLVSEDIMEEMTSLAKPKSLEQRLFSDVLMAVNRSYANEACKHEENQKRNAYFINQWVHQMKTPVSVINLILQEEHELKFKNVLDSIGEENEKLSQGLSVMLYNARLDEFNRDFNVEEADVLVILRKVINDNKKMLIRNRVFPAIEGGSALVRTDKKWMGFVINQIVINAIKYTAASEKDKKTISCTIKEDDLKIVVSIEDNGIGIPKEDMGRVFDAFFTGKNGRKTSESTGMGMYLSKCICEELGNELHVESEEGRGTAFRIVFHRGKNIFKF